MICKRFILLSICSFMQSCHLECPNPETPEQTDISKEESYRQGIKYDEQKDEKENKRRSIEKKASSELYKWMEELEKLEAELEIKIEKKEGDGNVEHSKKLLSMIKSMRRNIQESRLKRQYERKQGDAENIESLMAHLSGEKLIFQKDETIILKVEIVNVSNIPNLNIDGNFSLSINDKEYNIQRNDIIPGSKSLNPGESHVSEIRLNLSYPPGYYTLNLAYYKKIIHTDKYREYINNYDCDKKYHDKFTSNTVYFIIVE